MISDNERREMARRLREYASWDEDGELVGCTEFGEAVLNLLSCGDTERECFNALADLIKPEPELERTCRYVRDHMGVAGNWFCKCSDCGAEFDERVVDSHFVYCPECGARMIGEEAGDAD